MPTTDELMEALCSGRCTSCGRETLEEMEIDQEQFEQGVEPETAPTAHILTCTTCGNSFVLIAGLPDTREHNVRVEW